MECFLQSYISSALRTLANYERSARRGNIICYLLFPFNVKNSFRAVYWDVKNNSITKLQFVWLNNLISTIHVINSTKTDYTASGEETLLRFEITTNKPAIKHLTDSNKDGWKLIFRANFVLLSSFSFKAPLTVSWALWVVEANIS